MMKLLRSSITAMLAPLLVVVCVLATAGQGAAQDYTRILNLGSEESEPQQSEPLAPPTPSASASESSAPTVEDYNNLATELGDPMLDATSHGVKIFRDRLRNTIDRLPQAWYEIKTALAAASPTGKGSYFLGVALFACLLLMIGRSVTLTFMVYIARRWLVSMQQVDRQGYLGKLPILALRFMMSILGVTITVSIATAAGLIFYQEHRATLLTVIVVFGCFGGVNIVDTLWRMAVAPYFSEYRLPRINDEDARSLYRWLSSIFTFGIITMSAMYWMRILGLSVEVYTILTISLSLIAVIGLLAMIRRHRHTITGAILAGKEREEASWLSLLAVTLWMPAVSLYILVTWGGVSFRLIMGIEDNPLRLAEPYAILMAGLMVYAIAAYIIERIFHRSREIAEINKEMEAQRAAEETAEMERIRDATTGDTADMDGDGDEEGGGAPVTEKPSDVAIYARRRYSMRTLEDLARRTASLFALGAVAYALVRFWGGPDVFERIPGLDLAEGLIDTLLIGYVIYHAVRIWIDRKIEEEIGEQPEDALPGDGEGGTGATRLATLLPLFRNFLLIVIVLAIALLVAVDLGVNVAPLFAGAGIVGLAIGFGSQALVRDILSGAFFLMDDAFRKGEYIDVGDVKGTVEKISLRSFQLRHHLGMLHTIPFGEIQYLTNFSRDWVMMKLKLRVTYDTDVEKVRKLIKKLGLALAEDPEIGHKFIQPLKSQGVIEMDDSAMILRVKFMTHPGEQWVLRKRIFAELRILFEREGIKFAHREVTVRIPDLDEGRQLTEEERRAIGAAARRVGDKAAEDGMAAAGGAG